MGVGKTSFAKKLSNKLNFSFLDLDKEIENKENSNINFIFENKGENYFRKIEKQLLKEIIENNNNFVLSCGGGTACYNNNIKIINNNGISICISLPITTIIQRLNNSKTKRPLLKNIDKRNIFNEISSLMNIRKQYYEQANFNINGLNYNIEEVINKIKNL